MAEELSKCSAYTYNKITKEEGQSLGDEWVHCVHIMLYTTLPEPVYLFDTLRNEIKNTVMMQMRFDGRLGFPGGLVDNTDNTLEDALYREVSEEMGTLPKGFSISTNDYMFSHRMEEKKYCLHFYSKELTYEDFKLIERRSDNELYEGFEVLGAIRVPLFLIGERGGFPAFLRNNFIGSAKLQLLDCLRIKKLLPNELLDRFIEYSKLNDDPLSTTA